MWQKNWEKEIACEPIRKAGVIVIMSDFHPSNCCQETCETSEQGEGMTDNLLMSSWSHVSGRPHQG